MSFWRDMLFAVAISIVCIGIHMVTAEPIVEAKAAIMEPAPAPPPKLRELTNREMQCVRNAVYGEARGEPFYVQVAVAATIINRSQAGRWPNDLCKVVKQEWQFQGYSTVIRLNSEADAEAWDMAMDAVLRASLDYYNLPEQYRDAVFFHSANMGAAWAGKHRLIGKLGGLIFYG